MADSSFSRLDNFIDTVSDGNYKLSYQIFDKHDSLLHGGIADADINNIYNYFHPLKTAYYNAYTAWENMKGQGLGGTQSVAILIDDLSGNKIRTWDVAIQNVYDVKSNKYKTLLPHRRTPFQSGGYASRIAALSALIQAIGNDAAIAAVKGLMTTFYNALVTARDAQQGDFGAIDNAITTLDNTRLAAAQAMFKNYGSLIVKYFLTPDAIGNYLPIELLQSKQQTKFTGHNEAGESDHIFKRKLDPDKNHLAISNDGDNSEEFFFTNGMTDEPTAGQATVVLTPHKQQDVAPSALGYSDEARHLYVRNIGTGQGAWRVAIE